MNNKGYTLWQFTALAGLVAFWGVMVFLAYQHSQADTSILATEKFLQQVRLEQEARCEFGRNYAVYTNELSVFAKPTDSHLRYDLSSGVGVTAFHDQYNYALSMPSYADGRFCCDNCEELRIKYPPCDVLKKTYDYLDVKNDCSVLLPQSAKITPPVSEKKSEKPQPVPSQEVSSRLQAQERVTPEEEPTPVVSQSQTSQPPVVSQSEVLVLPAEQQPEPAVVKNREPALQTPSVLAETESTAPSCVSGEKGLFYSEPCSRFMASAQGTVLFSWNDTTCKYEAVQNCSLPALWEKLPVETHAYPDVYPSDVESFCQEILEHSGCEADITAQVKKGKKVECPLEEETTCYSDCRIQDKMPVQETAQIVLYNLTVSLDKLYCSPARQVQVKIP